MTRGVLIFAFNNESTDYERLAQASARRIQRHLGVPTTIINDESLRPESSGCRYWDHGQTAWYNQNRCRAYELSPYDETLVLDADYVVASDQLSLLWQSPEDLLAPRSIYDVTGLDDCDSLNHWGRYRMPTAWATVIFFRRSAYSEAVFEMMNRVQRDWTHYRDLYAAGNSRFRNDYALAIAQHVVSGSQGTWNAVPWSMATVYPQHRVTTLDQDSFRVDYVDSNKNLRWIKITSQDLHVMDKKQLEAIYA
jgi:hypothetical protein